MGTVKAVLWSVANKAGKHPIKVRITENGKPRYIGTGYAVSRKEWNPKRSEVRSSVINHAVINERIQSIILNAQQATNEMVRNKEMVTSRKVKERASGGQAQDLFEYAFAHIKNLEAMGKGRTAKRRRSCINKFQTYVKSKTLDFSEVDIDLLKGYEIFMKRKGNKPNTINKDFLGLKFFFNKAIKEKKFASEKNPFLQFDIPKKEKVFKEKLSVEELRSLFSEELPPGSRVADAQNIFKFAFYTGGLRVGDILLLKWRNIVKGRLVIQTEKTDDPKSTKLLEPALQAISGYRKDEHPDHFIFPFLSNRRDYSDPLYLVAQLESKTSQINRYLKQIATKAGVQKTVTTHIARHSMADYLRRSGKSLYDISKILGHSNIAVTQTYLKSLDYETVDAALDALGEV